MIRGKNHYLLAALPALGDFGAPPPMAPHALLEFVDDAPCVRTLLEELFLGDDLLLRSSVLAGQVDAADAQPAVLTPGQLTQEEPLPEYLVSDEQDHAPRRIAEDAVWETYFRHASATAAQCRSTLLDQWVRYEVTLRNTLAAARAKALDLDVGGYLLATELSTETVSESLISDWSAAENPLAALRVVDRYRWEWLADHDGWFTFTDDELLAYGAKLMLLSRWQRLQSDTRQTSPAGS